MLGLKNVVLDATWLHLSREGNLPQFIEVCYFAVFNGHWGVRCWAFGGCLTSCFSSLILNVVFLCLAVEGYAIFKRFHFFFIEDMVDKAAFVFSISARELLSASVEAVFNE